MLHVWYIYLQMGDFCWANVGKYSIHGAYGILDYLKKKVQAGAKASVKTSPIISKDDR